MDFAEKLNYLFKLTGASGKDLAEIMSVTPPQISKMRKGLRGLPRSRDYAMVIARFFAERCNSDFQREALSKTINVRNVRWQNDVNALADTILSWLADELKAKEYAADRADIFLRQFGSLYSGIDTEAQEGIASILSSENGNVIAYFGNNGKRVAATTFLNHLLQLKQPFSIDILSDENIGWSTDDSGFSMQLHQTMVKLSEQGCTFRRIAGPIADMDQAFESLNRWFPLYMTGKATSYYYNRMRDNLARMTLFVVRDVAAMFSFSVGNAPRNNGVTFFTTDPQTANSMSAEFNNYLSLCEPIMKVYNTDDSYTRIHEAMIRYDEYAGSCIQKSDGLSFITLPWDIAASIQNTQDQERKNEFLTSFARRYKAFKLNLANHAFVDIIRLDSVDDVLNGLVPIPAAMVLGEEKQYYTPQGYVRHLKNILYFVGHMKNYRAVIRQQDKNETVIMYVKEGFCTILARDQVPFALYEVSEHYLVDAFAEYLKRLVPEDEVVSRQKVISAIKDLITTIEKRA